MTSADTQINNDCIVQVQNLSKRYILSKGTYQPTGNANRAREFWALNDVSF
ncbi:MAG: hypothetical protein JWO06_2388, partial [Bacteroidota bacterium]|nr:hypothetical protein [Bacteroidota bacterium]